MAGFAPERRIECGCWLEFGWQRRLFAGDGTEPDKRYWDKTSIEEGIDR